jgi:hypothetical protein
VKSAVHDMLANALDLDVPRINWRRWRQARCCRRWASRRPPTPRRRTAGEALRALLGNPAGKARGTDQWLTPPIVRPASLLRKGEFDPRAFD